ncbi:hypothetical protein SKAU_G00402650 [Synaphobranchus kaupii]|uniref:Uncharacterized protein n=1 Tax=Synaphobranchus kaupii TaxID=118154 RepID=A0A9Q1E9E0_SYNKA|nr:hypothetical protein SKAU_G00402650 [Synaphobranchus kaupii]
MALFAQKGNYSGVCDSSGHFVPPGESRQDWWSQHTVESPGHVYALAPPAIDYRRPDSGTTALLDSFPPHKSPLCLLTPHMWY